MGVSGCGEGCWTPVRCPSCGGELPPRGRSVAAEVPVLSCCAAARMNPEANPRHWWSREEYLDQVPAARRGGAGADDATASGWHGIEGRKRPLVMIDFDGVINVWEASGKAKRCLSEREGWVRRVVTMGEGPESVFYNPAAGAWLNRLARETDAELAWCSMRQHYARIVAGPPLGLENIRVCPLDFPRAAGTLASKADSLVPWTQGRPFAWFDDWQHELDRAGELARDQDYLPVPVNPREGLTEHQVDRVRDWLMTLAGEDPVLTRGTARCGACGQEVRYDGGEWRNPHGFPTCPRVAEYPYRHSPEAAA